jgi:hypothetical protein
VRLDHLLSKEHRQERMSLVQLMGGTLTIRLEDLEPAH